MDMMNYVGLSKSMDERRRKEWQHNDPLNVGRNILRAPALIGDTSARLKSDWAHESFFPRFELRAALPLLC